MSEQREEVLEILKEAQALDENLHRQLSRALQALSRPQQVTYNEFLTWADEDTLAEWVDGEIVMTTPASRHHQEISGFLYQLLSIYVERHRLGVVILPPFQMKLAHSGREPDLLFVTQEHLDRLRETHLDGPADMVVEILSPESAGRDRGDKFYEYEEAGIPEYWLIDPLREEVEFYRLDHQGRYRLTLPDTEGVYCSKAVHDFRLPVVWLWQPPHVLDALRQLGLV